MESDRIKRYQKFHSQRISNTYSRTLPERLRVPLIQIVLFLSVTAIWELLARRKIIDPLFIGTPTEIFDFLWRGLFENGMLTVETIWTVGGTLLAFLVGSGMGIIVGFIFTKYPTLESILDPFLSALNALPRIALAPLFLLWFGLGLLSKVALGASLTFFIVLSSTVAGIRSVDLDLITLARTLGASPIQRFRLITLPSAIPTLFAGLRLGLIYSMLGVIAGELIGAEHGLGQKLGYLSGTFQTNGVFAILIWLAAIGSFITWLMSFIERRLLRWR